MMLAPSAARRALLQAPPAAARLLDTLLAGPRRHKSTQQQRAPQEPKPKGAWVRSHRSRPMDSNDLIAD
jgi:hypothetical protein